MSKRDYSKRAKQVCAKPYLELRKVGQTFLTFNGQRYSVEAAPPEIFDQWIRQFVNTILNVDTFLWDIFDRWQIINAVLDGGFLTLENGELNRKKKLPIREETPAISTSDVEEKTSVSDTEGK